MTVGVEIGNTKSCIATINALGMPELVSEIQNKDNSSALTPTLIHIDSSFAYVGEMAKLLGTKEPVLLMAKDFKDEIGKSDISFKSQDGMKWKAEELTSIVLRKLKLDVEANESSDISGAVCCLPFAFNDYQRKALRQSFEWSNIPLLSFLETPLAIVYGYDLPPASGVNKNILVIDIGTKTAKITIVKREGVAYKIMDQWIVEEAGGDFFNEQLKCFILEKFIRATGKKVVLSAKNNTSLNVLAEKLKIKFSAPFVNYQELVCTLNNKSVIIQINRMEFEALLEEIISILDNMLKDLFSGGELIKGEIDFVLLAGGTSALSSVKNKINLLFENAEQQILCDKPQTIAVKGATKFAEKFARRDPPVTLASIKVTQKSNGMEHQEHITKKHIRVMLNREKKNSQQHTNIGKMIINNII